MLKPRANENLSRNVVGFRQRLIDWYCAEARDYPWRRTTDPYAILVSEVMLQQTRLSVVLGKGYYMRFMEALPTVQALAAIDEQSLLRLWEGLGYYRRARMLQSTARAVCERHDGIFPTDEKALLALPGIGPYTAAAVRSFAYDFPSALVDGNVMRVLSRLFDDDTAIDSSSGVKSAWQRAGDLLDPEHPRWFNSAIMELGQRICKVGVPDCLSCPVSSFCRSRRPELLPVKAKKTLITEVAEYALWCLRSDGSLLLHCEKGKRRTGLWRLPLRQQDELAGAELVHETNYAITRYRVHLQVYSTGSATLADGDAWIAADELVDYPMAAPHRKVLNALLG